MAEPFLQFSSLFLCRGGQRSAWGAIHPFKKKKKSLGRDPLIQVCRSPCFSHAEITSPPFSMGLWVWETELMLARQTLLPTEPFSTLPRRKSVATGQVALAFISSLGPFLQAYFFLHPSETRLCLGTRGFSHLSQLPPRVGNPLPSSARAFCLVAVFTVPWSQAAFFCALFKYRMTVH